MLLSVRPLNSPVLYSQAQDQPPRTPPYSAPSLRGAPPVPYRSFLSRRPACPVPQLPTRRPACPVPQLPHLAARLSCIFGENTSPRSARSTSPTARAVAASRAPSLR